MASAIAAGLYLYQHVDDELRRRIEVMLADHYPHLQVKVRSASLIEGEGIEVRGLSLRQPNATGPRAELAHFDEIMFHCDARLVDMMQHDPEITKIVIRRPVFLATRRSDGSWSTSQLLPLPHFSETPPKIVVEGCLFEFFDPLRNPTSTLVVRDVHLTIDPQAGAASDARDVYTVNGFMTGDFFQRIEFKGHVSEDGLDYQFAGNAEGLDLSPEFYASLPGPLAEKLDELACLRAQSRFRFDLSYDAATSDEVQFDLDGQLTRGRLEDSRLPYPLSDLVGRVRVTNEGIHVSDLRARNGKTALHVRQAWRRGFDNNAPLYANLECKLLVIDRALFESLPEQVRVNWYDYLLAGTVNLDAALYYDGQRWHPTVNVECVDTSFTYRGFPYRLENGQGRLHLKDDQVKLWLTAYSGADEISLRGQIDSFSHEPGYWLEVQADQLAIDRKLLDALPEQTRDVIQSLHPTGRFSLFAETYSPPGSQQEPQQRVRLSLDHCSLRYAALPFPIYNVCGTMELNGNEWTFRNLKGNNDTATLQAHGRLGPTPHGNELQIRIEGVNVALEDELRNALPDNVQHIWHELRPRGKVNLGANVRYAVDANELDVQLGIAPQGDSVAIEPRYFPYRIEAIQGELFYDNGRVILGRHSIPRDDQAHPAQLHALPLQTASTTRQQPSGGTLRGRHQGVDVALRGVCDLKPDGSWHMQLDDFSVYRLRADRDLQAAVPPRLNQWLRKLDPNDPINARGRIELYGSGRPDDQPHARWNITATLHRLRFNGVLPLENIFGLAHISGQYDGDRFLTDVELDLDSLTCHDMQITRITGPLRVDNEQVLLGAWAQRGDSSGRPRPITAQAYGGWLLSDGWVKLEDVPRFGMQITAGDIDVQQVVREAVPGSHQLSGKANVGVNVRGTTEGVHTLSGTGYMRLRDADIYRLPQMVALLNILRLKPPDKASLTHSEADFRIDGDRMYFDRINFSGDTITLRGQGEMNFSTELALTLYASVGRGELAIPLIPELFRAASQQLMLIHVNGKMSDPLIQRDPFPMVNQALGALSADLQGNRPGGEYLNTEPAPLGQRGGAGAWLNNPDARPIFPLQSGRPAPTTR